MKRYRGGTISVIILSFCISLKAQVLDPHDTLLYNNGGIFIDSSVVFQVYGKTVLDGAGSLPTNLLNHGSIFVHFDSVFLGVERGFVIDRDAVVFGNGYYEIEPDWTNNSRYFYAGQSKVHLMSDVYQRITGTDSSSFYQLELSGKGSTGNDRIKRTTKDLYVQDLLDLNNKELATDSFNLYVLNTVTSSIIFTSTPGNQGFVSNLKGKTRSGSVHRRTANSQTAYIYPLGSSVSPPGSQSYIYRPVEILPENVNINTYAVRFLHESPDIEGYDQFKLGDSVCSVNPRFYHMVNHPSGSTPAGVRIYYDPLTDGVYDNASQWGEDLWNLDITSQFIPTGVMLSVVIPKLEFFSYDSLPIILSDRIPGRPAIVGDNDICSNSLAMLRAVGNTRFYGWQIPSTIEMLSDLGDDTLIMKVADQGGYINLSALSSTGRCEEASDSFLVIVNPGPSANFIASESSTFTNIDVHFRDSTIGSPIEWFWDFGDGNSAASPVLKHRFSEVGDFLVVMYVKDENGCLDSTYRLISVIEGLSVPNVFSPNGDGKNDLFYIPNSGIGEYYLQIFNRWGAIMFETRAPEISWDGYTNNGEPAREGTYYYILEAKSEQKDYVLKGYLTIFR